MVRIKVQKHDYLLFNHLNRSGMDKRSTFITQYDTSNTVMFNPSPGLTPYAGPWNYEQAAHLLRRCTYGPTDEQIQSCISLGLEGTLDKLFEDHPFP